MKHSQDSTPATEQGTTQPTLNRDILLVAVADSSLSMGRIEVAGVQHYASYAVSGFERRWDFGPDGKDSYNYALIISPDGTGRYFDFTQSSKVSAKLFFQCAQPS